MGWFDFLKKKKKSNLVVIDAATTINNSILRYELTQAFPGISHSDPNLGDAYYHRPTADELWEFVQEVKIDHLIHSHFTGGETADAFDCNAYALYYHAKCREKMRLNQHPWAFGELWMETSKLENHGYNLCLTRNEGFYLVWPQTKIIEKLRQDVSNKVFFLYF